MGYTFEALFAVFRVTFWFILLFGGIAPLLLSHVRRKKGLDRLIYAWVGLGGLLIALVYTLTFFHLYDFFSLALALMLVPLSRSWVMSGKPPIRRYIARMEQRMVVRCVKLLEHRKPSPRQLWETSWARLKQRFDPQQAHPETFMAFGLALAGGLIRLYPALVNAAPFNRNWYFELERVKHLTLQNFFGNYPEPTGMHVLVNVFSKLTQVSPELILHLQGGLSVFLLGILIYWVLLELSEERYPAGALFGTGLYALTPLLIMPITFERQIEANSLELALCFALPTIMLLLRKLRSRDKVPEFYLYAGFFATGMVNLFVAYVVLLPALMLILASPTRADKQERGYLFIHVLGATAVTSFPFMLDIMIKGIEVESFLRLQLFDTRVFSYYPRLLMPMGQLSGWYILGAALLALVALARYYWRQSASARMEIIYLLLFILVSIAYVPYFHIGNVIIDTDQLSAFYAVLVAILGGLIFINLVRGVAWIAGRWKPAMHATRIILFAGGVGALMMMQGGIVTSRTLPSTMPNDFYNAYYKIINERLPYTYATVWPELNRNLATNRHYFMNYQYLLNDFADIDSTYYAERDLPLSRRSVDQVPPASVFVFVENPPYGDIQQGILYNAGEVMQRVERWIRQYARKPNRTVRTFYHTDRTTVYELEIRPDASDIDEVLSHTRPTGGQP